MNKKNMIKYIGICDTINWDNFIDSLKDQKPAYIGPRHRIGDVKAIGIDDVLIEWEKAGHVLWDKGGNAKWDMFLPDINFDRSIAEKFTEWCGLTDYTNIWVSRVTPGNMAPWHWDVTDHELTLQKENHVRFHCHIGRPEPGHVLIVEDQCFYNQPQGAVYQWPGRRSWHAGGNLGFNPKYLLNLWL
jgi:hypothetical protein